MGEYTGLAPEFLQSVSGKRVLVRSDLNVPLDGARITDDGRIRASVPTIEKLADAGARVVVTAHLGRPDGAPDPAYSLAPDLPATAGAKRPRYRGARSLPRWEPPGTRHHGSAP